jgi:hypothetical protein
MFERAVPIRTGEVVERDGFVFADLLLVNEKDDETPVRAESR